LQTAPAVSQLLPLQWTTAWVSEQAVPQEPQLASLLRRSVSQPLVDLLLSQSPKLDWQPPKEHVLLLHEAFVLGRTQEVAQTPQLFKSLVVLTSQPLDMSLSQLA